MVTINTALCSFGMSGLVFHAPFIEAHPGFNFYGVWERSAKTAREKYPCTHSFDTLEDMLADELIELVVVNTPNYTHFDFAKKAILAGKHVLVEKSFTVTVREAEKLITLANGKGKKLAVFQNRRYDSDLKTVQKIIKSRQLGNIIEAEFHFDRFKPTLSPKTHKEPLTPGAGLLHDLGPHLIDQAIYLFGMPQSLFGHLKITRPLSLVNDYMDVLLFYPLLTVRLKGGYLVKEPLPSYILHGTKGSFLKPRTDVQEDALKAGLKPVNTDWGTEPSNEQGLLNVLVDDESHRQYITSEQGNYMDFYESLYQAIIHDTALPVTGNDGLKVMKIIEAILQSDELKKVVELEI